MANQISLLSYLQTAPPAIPTNPPARPGRNTTNRCYRASDIHSIAVWQTFNLNTIMQDYRTVLNQTQLAADPMPASPPRPVPTEDALKEKLNEYITPRVRRALRAGFGQLAATGQDGGTTAIVFGSGGFAKKIRQYTPDAAYFDPTVASGTSRNRAPGDFKPSWKWTSALATDNVTANRTRHKQVLAQVNYYMKQHQTRYGFILTDRELVAIRRLDYQGNLELAAPIPFATRGTVQQPQLTVLLALWYLGMLAAQDQGADYWSL